MLNELIYLPPSPGAKYASVIDCFIWTDPAYQKMLMKVFLSLWVKLFNKCITWFGLGNLKRQCILEGMKEGGILHQPLVHLWNIRSHDKRGERCWPKKVLCKAAQRRVVVQWSS
jgi:hypothetical protein